MNVNLRGVLLFIREKKLTRMDADEHRDLVRKYHIMQAPTLVVDNGTEPEVYSSIVNVQKYIFAHKDKN